MRCPDCNKFVPYDTESEPEENYVTVSAAEDGTGHISVELRRVLPCEECGTELKAADFTLEQDLTFTVEAADDEEGAFKDDNGNWRREGHEADCVPEDAELSWDLTHEPTTGVIDRDRRGKKITNPRYMKTTYGVETTGSVTCSCGALADVDMRDEMPASHFDEC